MENFRRLEIHYAGNVQGVGFRYRARNIAQQYDVTGLVRNLDDGRVQVVAEGEKDELLAFMREIDQQMERYIRNKSVVWGTAHHQFVTFDIRA
jgi:acylphosphatase